MHHTAQLSEKRAPIRMTLVWVGASVVAVIGIIAASIVGLQGQRALDQEAFTRTSLQQLASRIATSVSLAYALHDQHLAKSIGSALLAKEPNLSALRFRLKGELPLVVGIPDSSSWQQAPIESFDSDAAALLLGDWPLQQIEGSGFEIGTVEFVPRNNAFRVTTPLNYRSSHYWPMWLSCGSALSLCILWGILFRSRIGRLGKMAVHIASGRFDHGVTWKSSDEVAWVGTQLQEITAFTREQVERVHDRNAELLRDITVQDDRINRLAKLATILIAPVDGTFGMLPALQALATEADANLCLLFERATNEHPLHCTAAVDSKYPDGVDSDRYVVDLFTQERLLAPQSLIQLPALQSCHPWMRVSGREIPLEGVLGVPLVFRDKLQGVLVLCSNQHFSDSDLEFLNDAARILAIALANHEAYSDSTQLASALEQRNEELIAQRDQLQIVNRLRREFVANMSHELRTPLNAIVCYAELMTDGVYGPTTKKQAHALTGIEHASSQLLELVNSVLDLSRAESGQLNFEFLPCEIGDLIEESILIAKPLTRDKGYEPIVRSQSQTLLTDRNRIAQILTNLLNNAIKFTESGSVTIEHRVMDNGGAEIRVIDTGTGISQDNHELIFEQFRQVDGSSTRTHDGVGLGLAISRRLARAMGGDLSVESRIGQGSTFTLYLPLYPPTSSTSSPHSDEQPLTLVS